VPETPSSKCHRQDGADAGSCCDPSLPAARASNLLQAAEDSDDKPVAASRTGLKRLGASAGHHSRSIKCSCCTAQRVPTGDKALMKSKLDVDIEAAGELLLHGDHRAGDQRDPSSSPGPAVSAGGTPCCGMADCLAVCFCREMQQPLQPAEEVLQHLLCQAVRP